MIKSRQKYTSKLIDLNILYLICHLQMAESACIDSQPVQCSVGAALADACHSLNFCRKTGLRKICTLSDSDRHLLEWRSGVSSTLTVDGTLCFHHEKVFLSRYESLQKYCCDPFKKHQKNITSKHMNSHFVHRQSMLCQ